MKNKVQEFLNPKSAVALGSSAGMVIAFTTTLCNSFHWTTALVALILSALFSVAHIIYFSEKTYVKFIYWLICTLVIFHAAKGGNETLSESSTPPKAATTIEVSDNQNNFSLISVAEAAPDEGSKHKFYLSYTNSDGYFIYTNFQGKAYTNTSNKQTFKSWKW